MKLSEVVFLTVEELENAHAQALSLFGGPPGIRDRGLLESAAAAPQMTVFGAPAYATIALMAATLAHGIAKNHAFVDGNKRVAFIATRLFLGINGFPVVLPTNPWVGHFRSLAAGRLSREDLAGLLASEMGRDEPVESD